MYRNNVPCDDTLSQSLGTLEKQWGKTYTPRLATADPESGEEVGVNVLDLVGSRSGQEPAVPVGTITEWAGTHAPPSYLLCDGKQFDREEYPELYAILGKDTVPDLRGMFIRGLDNGRGVDVGRVLGSEQDDAIRNMTGSFSVAYGSTLAGLGVFDYSAHLGYAYPSSSVVSDNTWTSTTSFDASRQVPTVPPDDLGGSRPKNVAFNFIIKAKSGAIASSEDFTSAVVAVNAAYDRKLDKINISYDEQSLSIPAPNGKMRYSKRLNMGALPTSGVKTVPHNIANLYQLESCSGMAYRGSDGFTMPLPRVSPGSLSEAIALQRRGGNIEMSCGASNFSSFTESFVDLIYTCTDR